MMERQTEKFPSNTFLWLAAGSVLGSLTLRMMDRRDDALFVGEWAPTFLVLGLYAKLLRMLGRD
jgi:hypothetical protein